jgi:hypothetical protein
MMRQAVDALIAWCDFGPKSGKVDGPQLLNAASAGGYADFNMLGDRKAMS